MKKRPFVSVIVPVYQVEKYLANCLDSILSQTFEDFELLLIDDGCLDQSGRICEEYAKKDDRIKVFHKENGGVSSARNIGLSNAIGEWIFFSDSDDFLHPDCLEKFVNSADNDVDIIESGYEEISERGQIIKSVFTTEVKFFSNIDYISLFYFENINVGSGYHGYPWNKLFRKSVIDKNQLKFDQTISFKEDTLFIIQFACVMTGKAAIIPGLIYDHIYRDSGAMVRYKSFNKLTISRVDAIIEIYNTIHDRFNGKPIASASKRDIAKAYLIAKQIAVQNNLSKSILLKECKDKVIKSIGRRLILNEILLHQYYRLRHKLNPMTYIRLYKTKFM